MNITLWKSLTEDRYLAQIEFGGDLRMSFFGATEAAARERAENWYAAERKRQERISGEGAGRVAAASKERTGEVPRVSGHGLAGMVWMVNRKTHHLTRVAASDVAGLEQQGYQRGGPRSNKA